MRVDHGLKNVFFVKTKEGYVGNRRHSYKVGGRYHNRNALFRDARPFFRLADAEANGEPDDVILTTTIYEEDTHAIG